jgi:hypothetical protein
LISMIPFVVNDVASVHLFIFINYGTVTKGEERKINLQFKMVKRIHLKI